MTRAGRLLWLAAPLFLIACGGSGEEPLPSEIGPDGIRDLRVTVPENDAQHIDFVGGEWVVQPGEEKMICTHFQYHGEDTAFSNLETIQSKFGHHAVLLSAKQPLPQGTVEDCTNVEDMAKYDAFTIGDSELPPGRGIFLPKGKAMVLQSHYLNTSSTPIRIRDVVRAKEIAIADVQVWAGIYITNLLNFKIAPHDETTVTFDCTIAKDMKLLFVGGHMHEWGRKFNLQYGKTIDTLNDLYTVDAWIPDYRDNPPVTLMTSNPMAVQAGEILRTTCTWKNDSMTELSFPKEMCTTFGYAEGTKDPVVCSVDKVP